LGDRQTVDGDPAPFEYFAERSRGTACVGYGEFENALFLDRRKIKGLPTGARLVSRCEVSLA
jgi:hypothetical protein